MGSGWFLSWYMTASCQTSELRAARCLQESARQPEQMECGWIAEDMVRQTKLGSTQTRFKGKS